MIIGLVPFGNYDRNGKKVSAVRPSADPVVKTAQKVGSILSTPRTAMATPRTEPKAVSPASSFGDRKATLLDDKSPVGCPNLFKKLVDFARNLFQSKKPSTSTQKQEGSPSVATFDFKRFSALDKALNNALRLTEDFQMKRFSDLNFSDVYNALRAEQIACKAKITPEENTHLVEVLRKLSRAQTDFEKQAPAAVETAKVQEAYNALQGFVIDLEKLAENFKDKDLQKLADECTKLVNAGDVISGRLQSFTSSEKNKAIVGRLVSEWEAQKEKVQGPLRDLCKRHNVPLQKELAKLLAQIETISSIEKGLKSQEDELKERINDSEAKILKFELHIQDSMNTEALSREFAVKSTVNLLSIAGAGAASYLAVAKTPAPQKQDNQISSALESERKILAELKQNLDQISADIKVNERIGSSVEKERRHLEDQVVRF